MLKDLLTQGWAYHATESGRLAGELEAAADEARQTPAELVRYLQVSTHTIGEHMGDWARARRLGDQVLGGLAPSPETAKAWAYLSIARLLSGDALGAIESELTCLTAAGADFRPTLIEARFLLVAALVGCQRTSEGVPIYAAALELARRLGDAAPHRAVAIAANNLASELLEAPSRTPEETSLMQAAADASHEFWVKCGTWENDMRGYYLRALVANVADEPRAALAHVDQALSLIAANGAAPIDETFLQLARAHAYALTGDSVASNDALARSDRSAAEWDDPGLLAWHAEERARVFPGLPPRATERQPA